MEGNLASEFVSLSRIFRRVRIFIYLFCETLTLGLGCYDHFRFHDAHTSPMLETDECFEPSVIQAGP
jgi:hypothetical protein